MALCKNKFAMLESKQPGNHVRLLGVIKESPINYGLLRTERPSLLEILALAEHEANASHRAHRMLRPSRGRPRLDLWGQIR